MTKRGELTECIFWVLGNHGPCSLTQISKYLPLGGTVKNKNILAALRRLIIGRSIMSKEIFSSNHNHPNQKIRIYWLRIDLLVEIDP